MKKAFIISLVGLACVLGISQIYAKNVSYSLCIAAVPKTAGDTTVNYFGTYKVGSKFNSLNNCVTIGPWDQGSDTKTNQLMLTFPNGKECAVNVPI